MHLSDICFVPPPSSQTVLSLCFRHCNRGKSYPIKAQLRPQHTCNHWRCHGEGQLKKHQAQTIFHNIGMNAIYGKGRSGNRDRQDETGKHFLATNVKYMFLKSLFIHLQFAKRLNSFLYKTLKKHLADCMCLKLKIQGMHIMVFPLHGRQMRWCCLLICLSFTFPA